MSFIEYAESELELAECLGLEALENFRRVFLSANGRFKEELNNISQEYKRLIDANNRISWAWQEKCKAKTAPAPAPKEENV